MYIYIYIYIYIIYIFSHVQRRPSGGTRLERRDAERACAHTRARVRAHTHIHQTTFPCAGCNFSLGHAFAGARDQRSRGTKGSQGRGFEHRSKRGFEHAKNRERNTIKPETSCYVRPPFLGTPLVPSRATSLSQTCFCWGTRSTGRRHARIARSSRPAPASRLRARQASKLSTLGVQSRYSVDCANRSIAKEQPHLWKSSFLKPFQHILSSAGVFQRPRGSP